MAEKKKPDVNHLRWAVDQRAEVQRTLLALYEYVRRKKTPGGSHAEPQVYILDQLIGSAFSLWRAAFSQKHTAPTRASTKARKPF